MEVLIVLSTTIAYIYSITVVIVNMILKVPSPMAFFDVAPSKFQHFIDTFYSLFVIVLFMFVALGRWLENTAKVRTINEYKRN
jgi:Cu+-exporting ATPase